MDFYTLHHLFRRYFLNSPKMTEKRVLSNQVDKMSPLLETELFSPFDRVQPYNDVQKSIILTELGCIPTQAPTALSSDFTATDNLSTLSLLKSFKTYICKLNISPSLNIEYHAFLSCLNEILRARLKIHYFEQLKVCVKADSLLTRQLLQVPLIESREIPIVINDAAKALAHIYHVNVDSVYTIQLIIYCTFAHMVEQNGNAQLHAVKLAILYPNAKSAFAALEVYAHQMGPGGQYRSSDQFVHDACLLDFPQVHPNHFSKWTRWMQEDLGNRVFAYCFHKANDIEDYYESQDILTMPSTPELNAYSFYEKESYELLSNRSHFLDNTVLLHHIASIRLQLQDDTLSSNQKMTLTLKLNALLMAYTKNQMSNNIPFQSLNNNAKQGLSLLMNEPLLKKIQVKRKTIKQTQCDGSKLTLLQRSLSQLLQCYALALKKASTAFINLDKDAIIGISLLYKQSVQSSVRFLTENGLTLPQVFQFEKLDKSQAGINIPCLFFMHDDYPGYYFKKLDVAHNDSDAAIAAILGKLTACCQSLDGTGRECILHGITSPNGGFYVLFKGDFQNPSDEDKVVAQSWVWRGTKGELVFDSFEYNIALIQKLTHEKKSISDILLDFFGLASEKIMEQSTQISRILVGTGGKTPFDVGIVTYVPAVPIQYQGYRDSQKQRVINHYQTPLVYWVVYPSQLNKHKLTQHFLHLLRNGHPLQYATSLIPFVEHALSQKSSLKDEHGNPNRVTLQKFLERHIDITLITQEENQILRSFIMVNFEYHDQLFRLNIPDLFECLDLFKRGALITQTDYKMSNITSFLPHYSNHFEMIKQNIPIDILIQLLTARNSLQETYFLKFAKELGGGCIPTFKFLLELIQSKELIELFESPNLKGDIFLNHIFNYDQLLSLVLNFYKTLNIPFPYHLKNNQGSSLFEAAFQSQRSINVILSIITISELRGLCENCHIDSIFKILSHLPKASCLSLLLFEQNHQTLLEHILSKETALEKIENILKLLTPICPESSIHRIIEDFYLKKRVHTPKQFHPYVFVLSFKRKSHFLPLYRKKCLSPRENPCFEIHHDKKADQKNTLEPVQRAFLNP